VRRLAGESKVRLQIRASDAAASRPDAFEACMMGVERTKGFLVSFA
jgi:hypothetical protein